MDHWVVSRVRVRYLNLISKDPKALDTALRVLDHWQVLDNGRRLWDTVLKVLDHWVVSRGSVRYLNLISKNPKALDTTL